VRKAAYLALATLGLPSAEDALARGLELGESCISTAILESLAEVNTEGLRHAIRERLSDEDIWVRHHAATILGEMGEVEAEDDLLKVLAEDVPPVKAAAAGALARLASERAVPLLKDLYEGSDPSLRSAIERAIEEIGC
jgi:HEAT repeat protein